VPVPEPTAYPHHVALVLPAERHAAVLTAAMQVAGIGWDAWQQPGGELVIGFSRPEHADRFRKWIAEQGWTDLLAS
jgi:hypothetical protein